MRLIFFHSATILALSMNIFILISCDPKQDKMHYGIILEDPNRMIKDLNYRKGSSDAKPRIAIVSHYTTDESNLGFIDLITKNHRKYAALHGYDYFFRNGTITDKYFWPDAESRTFQLGLFWQKIEATKQLLEQKENGKYVYDYVMWIDTDALFTNIDLKLEEFINRAGKDKFFIVAEDLSSSANEIPHSCINSGVYLIKNSPEGRKLIEQIEQAFEFYKIFSWPEQLAIADILYGYFTEKDALDFKANPEKLSMLKDNVKFRNCSIAPRPGVEILLMRDFNSGFHWSDKERVRWNEKTLVAHFLGLFGPKVEEYAKVLLRCLEQSGYKNRAPCNPYNLNILLR